MSDVSVLSHEYQTASELSQTLNRALITLKKARLRVPTSETITVGQTRKSQRHWAETLVALSKLLDPEASNVDGSTIQIPGSLVARLRQDRRGDLAYFMEDLGQTIKRLESDLSGLTDSDIALLDHVAAAADAEASRVFRRLMRT